jgi:hypothetical protein
MTSNEVQRRRIRFQALPIGILVLSIVAGETCMAVERAAYTVVRSEPPYEIRDYARSVVATVTVNGSRSRAVNSGFRLLANYIFGANQQKSKIAMTAPVTQAPRSSQPVSPSTQDAATPDAWAIRFMMPAGYTLQSLPAPMDNRITLTQAVAHRVAAIRFSGFWSDANLESHKLQLLQWMQAQQLEPRSPATYAYYDPPWTPWFMRQIEVMIDVSLPE